MVGNISASDYSNAIAVDLLCVMAGDGIWIFGRNRGVVVGGEVFERELTVPKDINPVQARNPKGMEAGKGRDGI
jgi:hypothetical protein